jgi:hypothetical protein
MATENTNPYYVAPSAPPSVDTLTATTGLREGGMDWGRLIIDTDSYTRYSQGWVDIAKGGIKLFTAFKALQVHNSDVAKKAAEKEFDERIDAIFNNAVAGGSVNMWQNMKDTVFKGIKEVGFNTDASRSALSRLKELMESLNE